MKITNLTLLLFALGATYNGHIAALTRTKTYAQQNFNNYLKGVALSCGQAIASNTFFKSETITCTSDLINNELQLPPLEAFENQAKLEAWEEAEEKAWQDKKQLCFAAIKKEAPKLLLLITAYIALTFVQNKIPQTTLYQPDSRNEWIAINIVAPKITSWLFAKGIQKFGPQKPSRLYQWLLLVIGCCINYLTIVQIHAYYQPYTMPTTDQHIFNFTGNFLAPTICCQLVS